MKHSSGVEQPRQRSPHRCHQDQQQQTTNYDKPHSQRLCQPGHTIQAEPPVSVLDSLTLPTFKELKAAHYRIAAASRETRERAGREFRVRQPGIYAYLPYAPPTPGVLSYENALLSSFTRHVCAAMETKCGKVPVLRIEDLQATETRAKMLLAHRPTLKRVEKLGAVLFALGGILGVHYVDGIGVLPDRKRVLLKVLTLLPCFSAATNRTSFIQSSNSLIINNRQ